MKNRVVVGAAAKVNLYLEITGKRQDGYHTLDTVMQAVSLQDLIVIGRTAGKRIRVTCSRPGIPEDESNLAFKAARLLLNSLNIKDYGLHIHIDKRIPHGAGLGGGSADAGAVLSGLVQILQADLNLSQLTAMAMQLGADVPFALHGGCMRARGVGEILVQVPCALRDCWMVIGVPGIHQNTADAYALYDRQAVPERPGITPMLDALAEGDAGEVARAMHNDFASVFAGAGHPLHHATESIRRTMAEQGALGAQLTGSGSAVVGLFDDGDKADACAVALGGMEAFVVQPVQAGPKIVYWD